MNFILYFLIFFSIYNYSYAEKVINLTNGEWPPFSSKNLKHYGVFSKIVTEAFKLQGIEVKWSWFPWKRSYYLAKTGTYDGSITWAPTSEREKDFYFSDPVMNITKVIFHRKSTNINWNKIDDLKKYRISITRSYTYSKNFDNAVKNKILNITYVNKDNESFKLLISNRVDIFPMEKSVGYYILNKYFKSYNNEITTNKKPIYKATIHLVITRKKGLYNANFYLKNFNTGLKKLKKNGKYSQFILESERGDYIIK